MPSDEIDDLLSGGESARWARVAARIRALEEAVRRLASSPPAEPEPPAKKGARRG